jgi:DNA-binding LacI/PurR family transcriptional regulator
MDAGVARLTGYVDALEESGMSGDDTLVAYGDFSDDSGATAMRDLLARRPDLDAVFAASDPMAFGAMRVLKTTGRRIPDDVALVGFDGSPAAPYTDPPLTTVHQPADRMGREMARLLRCQIDAEPVHERVVIVRTHLEVRAST